MNTTASAPRINRVGTRGPDRLAVVVCCGRRGDMEGSKLTDQTTCIPDIPPTTSHRLTHGRRAPDLSLTLAHPADATAEAAPRPDPGPTLTRMKATHRRILRWVLGVLAAVVAVAALLAANLAAQLSGGWDEVFDRSHPLPDDPRVVAAREVAGATVDAEVARVVDEVVVPALIAGRVAQPALTGPDAATDRGIGFDSGCELGSHNWKRDDPYDLLCTEIRRAIVAGERRSRSAPTWSPCTEP